MKQKMKRFMAGFLALLTVVTTLFSNGTTAFAASSSANIAFWYASTRASGEVSELKAGYDHGKILYAICRVRACGYRCRTCSSFLEKEKRRGRCRGIETEQMDKPRRNPRLIICNKKRRVR